MRYIERMISKLKNWVTSTFAGAEDKQASQAVLNDTLKTVAPFLKEARDQLIERDMMIPRRYYFFLMFAYGAFDKEGDRRGFDDAKTLAVVLLYLREILTVDERDIPTVLGHMQDYRHEQEGASGFKSGADAYSRWIDGDKHAMGDLRARLMQLGSGADNFD